MLARKGQWIGVETDPATFVMNIGDLLMRWTNDRWLSNTHRVVNPPASVAAQAKRLSIAFFQQPNYDAVIECIASPGKAKYPPVRSGEYRDLKYRQTTVVVDRLGLRDGGVGAARERTAGGSHGVMTWRPD